MTESMLKQEEALSRQVMKVSMLKQEEESTQVMKEAMLKQEEAQPRGKDAKITSACRWYHFAEL